MKKEIWFNKRNRTTAADLIAMYRGLGYTDEQIKAEMLKIKAAQQAHALDAATPQSVKTQSDNTPRQ